MLRSAPRDLGRSTLWADRLYVGFLAAIGDRFRGRLPPEFPALRPRSLRRLVAACRPPCSNRTSPSAPDIHPQSTHGLQPIREPTIPQMLPPDRDNAVPSPAGGVPIPPALRPAVVRVSAASIPSAGLRWHSPRALRLRWWRRWRRRDLRLRFRVLSLTVQSRDRLRLRLRWRAWELCGHAGAELRESAGVCDVHLCSEPCGAEREWNGQRVAEFEHECCVCGDGEAGTWACGFRQPGAGGCAGESGGSRGSAAEAAAGAAGGYGDSGGAGAEFVREFDYTAAFGGSGNLRDPDCGDGDGERAGA